MLTWITPKGTLFGQADTRTGARWPQGFGPDLDPATRSQRPIVPTRPVLLNVPVELLTKLDKVVGSRGRTRWIVELIGRELK